MKAIKNILKGSIGILLYIACYLADNDHNYTMGLIPLFLALVMIALIAALVFFKDIEKKDHIQN